MRALILTMASAVSLTAAPALAEDTALSFGTPTVSTQGSIQDWTGAYVGGQLGWGMVDTNLPEVDGDDILGGVVAGYDFDFGQFVVGAGLDYDIADINVGGAATLENVWRAKVRGGIKIGDGLAYATTGFAQAQTSTLGTDDGYFIGAGYEHILTANFAVGGEILYHDFNNFNSTTTDIEATTLQLRGTFRF